MVVRMKTTVLMDDALFAQLKREAARQGRTMSEMIEAGLRLLFHAPRHKGHVPRLPSYDMGEELVDISDRDQLYDAMEGR